MNRRASLGARLTAALLLALGGVPLAAATPEPAKVKEPEPAKVMVMGVFHFANPKRDVVKTEVVDVMSPENQAYLEGLANRLAAFEPTEVLIECDPDEQQAYDETFQRYQSGEFELSVNENHQIGFRVAKSAGLPSVVCFDERTIGWQAGPLFDYMKEHDPAAQAAMDQAIESLTATMQRQQATLTLAELLLLNNTEDQDRVNKDLYLMTNAVGAGENFVGADAAASWWHRNFRMYANVQKVAVPGHRVLVIAGQGHTAILKELLAIDRARIAEDVTPFFETPVSSKER